MADPANPLGGKQAFEYFPMYCPPLSCNATFVEYHRPPDQPKYLEVTSMNGFMRVIYILYQFALCCNKVKVC